MDNKANYVGITRRIIAGVIDRIIMVPILLILYFVLMVKLAIIFKSNELGDSGSSIEKALIFSESNRWLVAFIIYSFYLIIEILIIARFACTPGQLLCGIYIKDINTLQNITIMQAIIRIISREIVFHIPLLLAGFIVWPEILAYLLILTMLVCAIFDKRKQFFHDKISRTVAINYKPAS